MNSSPLCLSSGALVLVVVGELKEILYQTTGLSSSASRRMPSGQGCKEAEREADSLLNVA